MIRFKLNLDVIWFVRENVLLCLKFRACIGPSWPLFFFSFLFLWSCFSSCFLLFLLSMSPPVFYFLSILFPPLQLLFYFVFLPPYFKLISSLVLSWIVPLYNSFFFSKIGLLGYHLFKRTCIFNGHQTPKGQKERWKALFLNIQDGLIEGWEVELGAWRLSWSTKPLAQDALCLLISGWLSWSHSIGDHFCQPSDHLYQSFEFIYLLISVPTAQQICNYFILQKILIQLKASHRCLPPTMLSNIMGVQQR